MTEKALTKIEKFWRSRPTGIKEGFSCKYLHPGICTCCECGMVGKMTRLEDGRLRAATEEERQWWGQWLGIASKQWPGAVIDG